MSNNPASILARLKNESIKRDIPNQQMITLFLHEEFSRRLGKSKYRDKFILKGGFLLYSLGAGDTRATMDSDYLMRNLPNEEISVEKVIKEIIEIYNIDEITFEFKGTERITEQNDYHGLRIKLVGLIGRSKTPIFIDLGIGDVIIPESRIISLETIIEGFEKPRIRAYPMETIVAEKLDAILFLMEASSRMKDYYDIYYLATSKSFDGTSLQEAIYNTFKNRDHLMHIKNIYELSKFKGIDNLNNMWNRFIEEEIRIELEFSSVIDIIYTFILPICEAIENDKEYNKKWDFRIKAYID
ncbi:nucleotidyl transferase AbiEii/AbiGii toxin family protein [Tissierella creatinini]|nr:nucleotidyl transferase AbiEii/AbiGii toxin family protein [Tissierella creatinini]TJX60648.1 nucleotidyl transferase AbiEii/AbiGii toxin family protein [Soehngenia saccharolytica]